MVHTGDDKMEVDEKPDPTKGSDKKDADADKDKAASSALTFEDLKEQCRWIEKGESNREPRFITRVLRTLMTTRKRMTPALLARLINFYFSGASVSKQRDFLLSFLSGDLSEAMDIDRPSAISSSPRSPRPKRNSASSSALLPEIEAYIQLLVLIYLLDSKSLEKAKLCADNLMERVGSYNRRTLDPLSAKSYHFYSLVYERAGNLRGIRNFLHARLRTATLRHDEDSQATLINCLLRNYLLENLYDFAGKLVNKVTFPESANNNEWARFLYYLGCIKAMQLEYSSAQKHLLQAATKSPQHTAVGFKQRVQKMLVTVELLLGEIPERSLFRNQMYRKSLASYLLLTQAVRTGDVKKFNEVLESNGDQFQKDGTHSLIVRLRQNVIRTAVKQIALAYSRISIVDIQKKLQLSHSDDAEYIVSKAIKDGVIEAIIDHDKGYMQSRDTSDVYNTTEPQQQFHNRISFCLGIYNQSVKAMRFPPKSYNKTLESVQERREREQQDLEFAKELVDEDEDFP